MGVFDWEQMMQHDAYKVLEMEQELDISGQKVITSRCPIRINGEKLYAHKAAPKLGEHKEKIMAEL